MVNLVYFFRQGGVYASWFRYSFPRPSVSRIRARVALSASAVCGELFSMARAYCHCHFLLIGSNKVSSSIQNEINLINVIVSSDRCCPELTPRLNRWEFMSNLQANWGTIWEPVPSKLQAESGELNEQLNGTFML